MQSKLVLVALALSTLVACGAPTATPAATAPTAAPAATEASVAATAESPATADAPAVTAGALATVAATTTATAAADTIAETPAAASQPSEQPMTQANQCAPGWAMCQTMADPKITIMGSRQVSQDAVDVVAHIYTDITSRFNAAYPKNKFDGYTIYMTNGEPWSELKNLAPIGTMWQGTVENGMDKGDELRGGTSPDYLWIDEQLICKKGIKTRNDAYAAGKRSQRDDAVRTFDQVIHEFGHAISYRFGLEQRILDVYKADPSPVERFPWSIQNTFEAPSGSVSDGERAFLNEIFSSSTTFSCDMYKLSEVNSVKLEVGKQYAFREANNTFRYFKLTSVNNSAKEPIRIDLCPNPGQMGWITMSDASNLTTVETALAEKLTPKGEPCTADVAPHGVFTNGASLPHTAGQNTGQSVATPAAAPTTAAAAPTQAPAAPSGTAPAVGSQGNSNTFDLVIGKQYALRGPNNTFQYAKLTHIRLNTDLVAYLFAPCPDPAPMGDTYVYKTDTSVVTTLAAAQAEGLAATNTPCSDAVAPPYVGAPNTAVRSAPLKLEIGKQYVVRQPNNTYEYHQLISQGTTSGGVTYYRGARCPDPSNLNQINIFDVADVLTVEGALAAKLTMTNAPCNTTNVPHGA